MYLSALRTCDEVHIVCLRGESIHFHVGFVDEYSITCTPSVPCEMYELVYGHDIMMRK